MTRGIERKFLISDDFRSFALVQSRVMQGYICNARGRMARICIRDDRGCLTIRGASSESGTSRCEWERELPLSGTEELVKLYKPGMIDKTRHPVRSGNHVFEIDEFCDENEGLIMAEVELGTEDEAFVKPGFIGEEATEGVHCYNSHLMKKPCKAR